MFDLFAVRNNLKSFAEDLAGVRVQIEEVKREIEDVNFAPLPDADVLELFRTWAERNASEYREHMKGILGGIRCRPTIDGVAFHRLLLNLELLPEPNMNRPLSHDKKMCGLLGPDAVVALIEKQLAAMNFPPAGLPRAERAQAVAVLEKKLAKLTAREAGLLATAEKAGLVVA